MFGSPKKTTTAVEPVGWPIFDFLLKKFGLAPMGVQGI
jgi:hypothetical protein